jgi:hypothetical protein
VYSILKYKENNNSPFLKNNCSNAALKDALNNETASAVERSVSSSFNS